MQTLASTMRKYWLILLFYSIFVWINIGYAQISTSINIYNISPSTLIDGTVGVPQTINVNVALYSNDPNIVLYGIVTYSNDLYDKPLACDKKVNIPYLASSDQELTFDILYPDIPQSSEYKVWAVIAPQDFGDCPVGQSFDYPLDTEIIGIEWYIEGDNNNDDDGQNPEDINSWIPTPYDYVLLSQIAYEQEFSNSVINGILLGRGWEYLAQSTTDGNDDITGYFAIAFRHNYTNEVVIAHRGTNFGGNIFGQIGDGFQDFDIAVNNYLFQGANIQAYSASLFYDRVQAIMVNQQIAYYHIHHAGHSLGGALAAMMAGCGYGNEATTFDSPGAMLIILNLGCTVTNTGNINSYMASPNLINSAAPHIGTIILIEPLWYNSAKRTQHNIPNSLTELRIAVQEAYRLELGPTFWRVYDAIEERDWFELVEGTTLEVLVRMLLDYKDYSLEAHDLQVNIASRFSQYAGAGAPEGSRIVSDFISWPVTAPFGFSNFLFPLETCSNFQCEEVRALLGYTVSPIQNSIERGISLEEMNHNLIEFVQPGLPLAHDIVVDIHVSGTEYTEIVQNLAIWLQNTSSSRIQIVSGDNVIMPFTADPSLVMIASTADAGVISNVSLTSIQQQMINANWRNEVNKDILVIANALPEDFDTNLVRITQELAFVIDPVSIHNLISTTSPETIDAYNLIASGAWGENLFVSNQDNLSDNIIEMMTNILDVIEVNVDIRPGNDQNPLNLGSNGVVRVAIISHEYLDAQEILPNTLTLSGMPVATRGNGRYQVQYRDLNDDNVDDAIFHFETEEHRPEWVVNDTLYLEGETVSGLIIVGRDTIRNVPPSESSVRNSCSRNYWLNNIANWSSAQYSPNIAVTTIFNIPSEYLSGTILDLNNDGQNDQLINALSYDAELPIKQLIREAVTAILNSDEPTIDFDLQWYTIQTQVNSAIESGTIADATATLYELNNNVSLCD